MKTVISVIFFCLFSIALEGQESVKSEVSNQPVRKNVVKFLPENLLVNSLSFEYERKFSAKNSILVGVGLPTDKAFADRLGANSSSNPPINDKLGTMCLRVAYRHYTGQHVNPVGFYISPYLKYQKITVGATEKKDLGLSTAYTQTYLVNGNTMGAGIQLGTQFLIAKRICVDFYFLGLEAGLANMNGTVTSSPNNTSANDKMKQNVDDFVKDLPSLFRDKIVVTQTPTEVLVKASSIPFPWYRGGISIGLAF